MDIRLILGRPPFTVDAFPYSSFLEDWSSLNADLTSIGLTISSQPTTISGGASALPTYNQTMTRTLLSEYTASATPLGKYILSQNIRQGSCSLRDRDQQRAGSNRVSTECWKRDRACSRRLLVVLLCSPWFHVKTIAGSSVIEVHGLLTC